MFFSLVEFELSVCFNAMLTQMMCFFEKTQRILQATGRQDKYITVIPAQAGIHVQRIEE